MYNRPDGMSQNACVFSSITAGTIYCIPSGNGTAITKYHLGTAPTIKSDGAIWTDPRAALIADGGSASPGKDDWACLFNWNSSFIYSINLANPRQYGEYNLAGLTPSIVSGSTGIKGCWQSVG